MPIVNLKITPDCSSIESINADEIRDGVYFAKITDPSKFIGIAVGWDYGTNRPFLATADQDAKSELTWIGPKPESDEWNDF